MTRVVGYVRVSTKEQATEGVSLEAQRKKIAAYCTAMDLELVDVIEDAGESGTTLDRPGVKQALQMLRVGEVEGLLVTKLDRLTRNVGDSCDLLDQYFGPKSAFKLISIADHIDTRSANGRLVFRMMMSIAQWEVETIQERTRDGLVQVKAEGVRLGNAGYGWRRSEERDEDGRCKVVSVESELQLAKQVLAHAEAGLSVRDIAARLESDGITTKKGNSKWQPTQIQRLLTRARRSAA